MNPYTESTAKRPRDEGEEDEESNKTGRITISSIPPLPPAHSETGIFEPSPPSSIENAINTATKDRLAKTLHRMILGSSEVRQLAESHLLVDHEAVLGTSTASSWTKRKKYEICKHCSKEYDILRNKHLDCMYHPGEKDIDWDWECWGDHDERMLGRPEDLMDVEDYLEGMLWTRCKNNGEAEYCTVGKHEVDESVVKRSCVDRQTTLESIIPSA